MDPQATEGDKPGATLGRRRFLRKAGLVGAAIPMAGGLIVSGCYEDPTGGTAARTSPGVPADQVKTPAATAGAGNITARASMDDGHKKGIEDFLQNQKTPLTKGLGNQPLAFKMDGNVKVFDLTVDEVDWETLPGNFEQARGFNNAIPGPILRATEGERVRINVKNNLTESTSVHWHGIFVPNNMDGVSYLTQDPIKPGDTFTYEFTLRNSGSHMYHSHHNSSDQVNRGLLGAFIIDPKDKASYPQYDKEYILILNDSMLGFTINGKGFPATEALTCKKGERVLVRWMNEGMMYHPMHLHGAVMEAFRRDGWPITPFKCDNIDVPPGSRMDVMITPDETGIWAFHCHVLSHAENTDGFFGLVTALVVTE